MEKHTILNLTGKEVVDTEYNYITPDSEFLDKLNKLCYFRTTPYGDSISTKCDKYLNMILIYCKLNMDIVSGQYDILIDVPNYMKSTLEELVLGIKYNRYSEYFSKYKILNIMYPHYDKDGRIRASVYVG